MGFKEKIEVFLMVLKRKGTGAYVTK